MIVALVTVVAVLRPAGVRAMSPGSVANTGANTGATGDAVMAFAVGVPSACPISPTPASVAVMLMPVAAAFDAMAVRRRRAISHPPGRPGRRPTR